MSEEEDVGEESKVRGNPLPALDYVYRFTYAPEGDHRAFVLVIRDRREFVIRELRKLHPDLRKEICTDKDHDAIAQDATEVPARLRGWLGTFLPETEVERLLTRSSDFGTLPPNCH